MVTDKDMAGKERIVLGAVAHVDAGKTTLAESLLYLAGSTRRLGRVDHKDAFLDTHELEKKRGITIFSKQAEFELASKAVTLLDTPGHVDFSAEMERTLSVLDYAVLLISASDGVGGHVMTLWRLLEQYRIPVFIFVNKMDQPQADKSDILNIIQGKLDTRCVDFTDTESEQFKESLAMTDEELLDKHLNGEDADISDIQKQIKARKLFPCYFGSALNQEGVKELMEGLDRLTIAGRYPDEFAASVYKISRDASGNRLTHMKIMGGSLKVKQVILDEKADQIRCYSGSGFKMLNEAPAGCVCAVTGLTKTYAGQGLGACPDSTAPLLEPVLTYRISFPDEIDPHEMYKKMLLLEEEDPLLHVVWQETGSEIHVQVMGDIQIEILKTLIKERFNIDAEFTSGSIIYKETIENTVEGVGHFEPLRHYAEVHLRMEPAERGSSIVCCAQCSEDILAKNWQRLILTHLNEKKHKGVLTGSELTDVKITLINGRAHIKHTEGGDFRQATYRAVRQGLMQAKSRLLEPYYSYRLELPETSIGRAMNDITNMHGTFSQPDRQGEMFVITGKAPVSEMRGYQKEVTAYTRGCGSLFCTISGYEPCHNEEEVIEQMHYDPKEDLENTPDSVFCSHGAGFTVPWDEVYSYMHLEASQIKADEEEPEAQEYQVKLPKRSLKEYEAENEELKAIFERTYGPIKKRVQEEEDYIPVQKAVKAEKPYKNNWKNIEEYLLVDGYNIIFAWKELNELAKINISGARLKLMDILSNYQGCIRAKIILVFDAYKVSGGQGSVEKYHNIYVVYTKEAETADQYIEKTVHQIGKKYHVTAATSDGLEQVIILGQGGTRMSASDLYDEIEAARRETSRISQAKSENSRVYLFHEVNEETAKAIEKVRLGADNQN